VAWSAANPSRIASTGDNTCVVFTPEGQVLRTLKHPDLVFGVDWHPTKQDVLCTGCQDGAVRVFDISNDSDNALSMLACLATAPWPLWTDIAVSPTQLSRRTHLAYSTPVSSRDCAIGLDSRMLLTGCAQCGLRCAPSCWPVALTTKPFAYGTRAERAMRLLSQATRTTCAQWLGAPKYRSCYSVAAGTVGGPRDVATGLS
jgi:hypothetical protein